MFDVVETLLTQLFAVLPVFIPLILILNLIASLLWGEK